MIIMLSRTSQIIIEFFLPVHMHTTFQVTCKIKYYFKVLALNNVTPCPSRYVPGIPPPHTHTDRRSYGYTCVSKPPKRTSWCKMHKDVFCGCMSTDCIFSIATRFLNLDVFIRYPYADYIQMYIV